MSVQPPHTYATAGSNICERIEKIPSISRHTIVWTHKNAVYTSSTKEMSKWQATENDRTEKWVYYPNKMKTAAVLKP